MRDDEWQKEGSGMVFFPFFLKADGCMGPDGDGIYGVMIR